MGDVEVVLEEEGEGHRAGKPQGDPPLAAAPGGRTPLDETLIVNGRVELRRTHPCLWRAETGLAIINLALGLDFVVLQPTSLIYGFPNELWGAIFLALGVAELAFLNLYRRLKGARAVMAADAAYLLFLAAGTTQPFIEGHGSLQVPIMYLALAAVQIPLVIEPFMNPWTARR